MRSLCSLAAMNYFMMNKNIVLVRSRSGTVRPACVPENIHQ
jgi:hypothetical protein